MEKMCQYRKEGGHPDGGSNALQMAFVRAVTFRFFVDELPLPRACSSAKTCYELERSDIKFRCEVVHEQFGT